MSLISTIDTSRFTWLHTVTSEDTAEYDRGVHNLRDFFFYGHVGIRLFRTSDKFLDNLELHECYSKLNSGDQIIQLDRVPLCQEEITLNA
jgi:hypothetical protein